MNRNTLPTIIQGGMGIAVSNWTLARAVAAAGQCGVVSGTAIDAVLTRRLQDGDPGGHVRRALAALPIHGVADRLIARYFVEGGKPADKPYRAKPMPSDKPSRALVELLIAANFVEVWLAKEGLDASAGPVGVNYLEKVQAPTLPSLYGAVLAGVDCVLMGAGIPRAIPGILDRLAEHQPVELRLDVQGADRDDVFTTTFDPADVWPEGVPAPVRRPDFLAIVSSDALASMLVRKASGRIDGFVIEGPTAGGHNAPPRGKMQLTARGEPIYGKRDAPKLEAFRELGLPFWLAGQHATAELVAEAIAQGAAGVQVGTAFAFCAESGLHDTLKQRALELARAGTADVFTDPVASPTGFPFKVLQLEGTLSDEAVYAARERVCDQGYLRQAYKKPDGTLGWRCPGEPIEDFAKKGGDPDAAEGRKCACNGLLANIGMGQVHKGGGDELPLVTAGDDTKTVARFLAPGDDAYAARDVIDALLAGVPAE